MLISTSNNVNQKFACLQIEFQNLRQEVAQMKTEMVTSKQFEDLEVRVHNLEQNVGNESNPTVKYLQTQLDKLDPARKSLAFTKFKGEDPTKRSSEIRAFLDANLAAFSERVSIDHIFKGPAGSRKLSPVSLVVFDSLAQKEAALKEINTRNLRMVGENGDVVVRFAKTKRQMHRNWAVNKAAELIQADARTTTKTVTINWKTGTDKGKRQVQVDHVTMFEQNADDASGRFLGDYKHLFLP